MNFLPRLHPPRALLVLLTMIALPFCRATTIIPPTFSELVAKAETVVLGEVTAISSELQTRGSERAIFTRVTFAIREPVLGVAPALLTLEFLGGTVGELTMDVDGMPAFAIGRSEILFVQNNGLQICPLVGMAHGRFRVARDTVTGVDFVRRDNGAALTNVAQVSIPLTRGPLTETLQRLGGTVPLTPAAFIAEIRAEHARQQTPVSR